MSKFTDAVQAHTGELRAFSVGPCRGCEACEISSDDETLDDERFHDLASEPHFSWSACESCGSTLGGDRHPAHYLDDENEIQHLDVCTDCVQYHANGDEPEDWRERP